MHQSYTHVNFILQNTDYTTNCKTQTHKKKVNQNIKINTTINKLEPSLEYWGLSIHCPHRSPNNLLRDTALIDLSLVVCSLLMSPLLARDIKQIDTTQV